MGEGGTISHLNHIAYINNIGILADSKFLNAMIKQTIAYVDKFILRLNSAYILGHLKSIHGFMFNF